MTNKYVLDTHAIVWYLEGNSKLGSVAKRLLDSTSDELAIPIIALAEATFIVTQGKDQYTKRSAIAGYTQSRPTRADHPIVVCNF